MSAGTLYGVGVGPGDPDLLTLKACTVIRAAGAIAYPTNGDGRSLARSIAAQIIPPETLEIPVHVPMAVERDPARAAYDQAAEEIAAHLDAGRSIAFLCAGDPLLYGSFIYLLARLGPGHPTEIVPGVTSLTACAAALRYPLAARNEVLKIVPATLGEETLYAELADAQAAAIIKVGRHFDKVRRVLRALALEERAMLVEAATAERENALSLADIPEGERPYFSTILVRRADVPC